MLQPYSSDRKTIVIRVPRKYRSLVAAFIAWLRIYPDQASLWQCEEFLSQTIERQIDKPTSQAWRTNIAAAYSQAIRHLQQSSRRAS